MNEKIERIKKMEIILDQLTEIFSKSDETLDVLMGSLPKLKELVEYYETDWREDHRADEQNEIPKNLKRGVLSEDAVYNLLFDYRIMTKKMEKIISEF